MERFNIGTTIAFKVIGSPFIIKYIGIVIIAQKNIITKRLMHFLICFFKCNGLFSNKKPLAKKNVGTQVARMVLEKYKK